MHLNPMKNNDKSYPFALFTDGWEEEEALRVANLATIDEDDEVGENWRRNEAEELKELEMFWERNELVEKWSEKERDWGITTTTHNVHY